MSEHKDVDLRPNDTSSEHPVPDPGIQHIPRYTDVDKGAGNRAYFQVVTLFGLVPVLVIAFVVVYFAVPRDLMFVVGDSRFAAQHLLLGLTMGLAILFVGVGAVHWSRTIMGDEESVEDRHPAASPAADREAIGAAFATGLEQSGIGRRRLIGASLGGALGLVGLPALVVLADMGPWPTAQTRAETLEKTLWAEGVHLVTDVTFRRIKAADIPINELITAQPENMKVLHGTQLQQAKAKASIIIVRMDPNRIKVPESRRDWHVGGIMCYSKICTHVGCPINLFERQTGHLLCPCHQSTFDLANSGVVIFGPAARSLPQLPITMDADGYLIARSDFTVPVGASYFERDSSRDFKDGDR